MVHWFLAVPGTAAALRPVWTRHEWGRGCIASLGHHRGLAGCCGPEPLDTDRRPHLRDRRGRGRRRTVRPAGTIPRLQLAARAIRQPDPGQGRVLSAVPRGGVSGRHPAQDGRADPLSGHLRQCLGLSRPTGRPAVPRHGALRRPGVQSRVLGLSGEPGDPRGPVCQPYLRGRHGRHRAVLSPWAGCEPPSARRRGRPAVRRLLADPRGRPLDHTGTRLPRGDRDLRRAGPSGVGGPTHAPARATRPVDRRRIAGVFRLSPGRHGRERTHLWRGRHDRVQVGQFHPCLRRPGRHTSGSLGAVHRRPA